jgi:hypothetical protein
MISQRLYSTVFTVLLLWLSFYHSPTTLLAEATELRQYSSNNVTGFEYISSLDLHSRGLPVGECNSNTPCENGACCGSNNLCGYAPKQCGTGCQSNCK